MPKKFCRIHGRDRRPIRIASPTCMGLVILPLGSQPWLRLPLLACHGKPRVRGRFCVCRQRNRPSTPAKRDCARNALPRRNRTKRHDCRWEGDFPGQIPSVGRGTNSSELPGRSCANAMRLIDFSMAHPYNSFVRKQALLSSSLSLSYLSLQIGGGV